MEIDVEPQDELKQFIVATALHAANHHSRRIECVESKMATKEELKDVERRLNVKIDRLDQKLDGVLQKLEALQREQISKW